MSRRPRVLVAPVTVTPSKPLTPSHLKGLFWADVMYRATAHLAEVTFRYSHTTYHPTEQTLGFWWHLDREHPGGGYAELSEEEIGELYVGFRAASTVPTAADLRPYAEAVEHCGWVHPASARVLELWTDHYRRLGLHDPGLLEHQPPGLGLEEAIDRLGSAGLVLDQRAQGGPVYLDATRFGLPLRRIVSPDGRPNYLACALRELLPLVPEHDEVVLLYDGELDPDYQLLERVLGRDGTVVRRVPIGRVPIEGRVASARHGGWRGYSASALLRSVGDEYGPQANRLGMRLYFVALLGPGRRESFRFDLLHQSVARARRLLDRSREALPREDVKLEELLDRHRRDHVYVDPYKLTSSLLGRRRAAPGDELLSGVFL